MLAHSLAGQELLRPSHGCNSVLMEETLLQKQNDSVKINRTAHIQHGAIYNQCGAVTSSMAQ